MDSSYFCFITLTTIGFGDMVPDHKEGYGEIRITLCSLYLLFGIAMICMSFNLVQVQVINNVKTIGKQLGIIKHLVLSINISIFIEDRSKGFVGFFSS